MLSDYKRYLLKIRNGLIRSGVRLKVTDIDKYEDIFYLGEVISDILWFYSILNIGGSEDRLRGFIFPLNSFYKASLRDKYFEEYLLYKAGYNQISASANLDIDSYTEQNDNNQLEDDDNQWSNEDYVEVSSMNAVDFLSMVKTDTNTSEFENSDYVAENDLSVDDDDFPDWNYSEEDGDDEFSDWDYSEEDGEEGLEDDTFESWGSYEDDGYDDSYDISEEGYDDDSFYDNWGNSEDYEGAEDGSLDEGDLPIESDDDDFPDWNYSEEDGEDYNDNYCEDDYSDDDFSDTWGNYDDEFDEGDSEEDDNIDDDELFDDWGNYDDVDDSYSDEDDYDDGFSNWGCYEEGSSDYEDSDRNNIRSSNSSLPSVNNVDNTVSKSKILKEIESNEKTANTICSIASTFVCKGESLKNQIVNKFKNLDDIKE